MKPWKIRISKYVLTTPYMSVRQDECERPDGSLVPDYYVIEERDYGMVFALTEAQEVVLVQQYKHGIGKMMLELPAGYFDDSDANPAAAAMREFREETGYDAAWYEIIGNHVRHPTRNTNRGHLLVAIGAHPATAQSLDPLEDIEVILLPVDDVFEKVRSGDIDAVGSVASIFFAWDYLKRMGRV